jgi:hypothetical protein
MYELTETEIDLISRDIDQQGLTYTLLKNELLDHICCSIEEDMEKGMTFNEAYRKVRHLMGPRRIRQIQDETLSLISKKYRRMKKIMYGLGIAIPIIIVVAIIFRLQHWPGGGILFTLALFTLGLFFLPIFAMVKIRDTRRLNEPVPLGFYMTGTIAGMLTVIGSLFKIQHMPGAGVLLSVGMAIMAFALLPMFAIMKIREANEKKESLNRGYLILGVVAGILFITGALFKAQHWPGTGVVLFSSWLAVAVILLPLLVMNILNQKGNRLNNFLLVVLAFSFVALLLLSSLTRPSRDLYFGFIPGETCMTEQSVYLGDQSHRLVESARQADPGGITPGMQSISKKADEICEYIESSKMEIIAGASERNIDAASGGRIDYFRVVGIDARDPVREIMIGPDDAEGKAYHLRSLLQSFKEASLSATENTGLRSFINTNLDLSAPRDDTGRSWEDYYFNGPLIQAASNLTMYQSTVRLIEYELLMEFSSSRIEP